MERVHICVLSPYFVSRFSPEQVHLSYGTGDLVDFGSYDTSVTDNDKNNLIEFTFGTDVLNPTHTERAWPIDIDLDIKFHGAIYKVTITPEGFLTRIKNINLAFENPKLGYNIELDTEGKITCLKVNGNTVELNIEGITLALSPGTIFPEFRIIRKAPMMSPQYYLYMVRGIPKLKELVEGFLRPHLSSRLSPEKLEEIVYKALALGPSPENDMKDKNFRTGNKSLNNFLASLSSPDKSKVRREFIDVLGAAFLPELLNNATSVFKSMISETLYIGPARARSERYYRYQDLAVSEIDPDGKNFPMFLNSLSNAQMRQLSKWIESLFGYGISVSRTAGPGHLSINIPAIQLGCGLARFPHEAQLRLSGVFRQ